MIAPAVEPQPAEGFTTTASNEAGEVSCFHCGLPCRGAKFVSGNTQFCCQGCLTVFAILSEHGLEQYYALKTRPGVRVGSATAREQFEYLDTPGVRERLVDFADSRQTRVTFHIPTIHCVACVWLLENLFRVREGIGVSRVNFLRKEVAITFDPERLRLSDVACLLASLGYEPDLRLAALEKSAANLSIPRLWLQVGLAGFGFGNIMLFSIASYLGLDSFSGPAFKKLIGYLSLALATPVVLYSGLDYWRNSWNSLRQKLLTIEVPIAAGIIAIYLQSTYDVLSQRGEGYFDSLCGLIFFLLCGRLFQQKTFARLAFERDYKSFFPLSVTRVENSAETRVSLAQLNVGDRLLVRNGELIPADSRLIEGSAFIDYSFVTGEAEPVAKRHGDYLYAGGRQIGSGITVEMLKPVSQSYLTSLWNQEVFHKKTCDTLASLTNRYSQRFTKIILGVAVGAAMYWLFTDATVALRAFTAVLIVACPCALALAAPFTLGTALRVLGRKNIFARGPQVIESLAQVDTVVFDKTGTLTAAGDAALSFIGPPLSVSESDWIYAIARQSNHPNSMRIAAQLRRSPLPCEGFEEVPGSGTAGTAAGHAIRLGSARWGFAPRDADHTGTVVHVAIDGIHRGRFVLAAPLRPDLGETVRALQRNYHLALLSGDDAREHARFADLFGENTELHFGQGPIEKLRFISDLQSQGRKVMMLGDGLNDAGALKQSDVGVAVVENLSSFSPASDIIMDACMVSRTDALLRFARQSVRIVRLSFFISAIYNLVGISIAATGLLAPIVCAILMPVSSVTVVAFACGMTAWCGRYAGFAKNGQRSAKNGEPVVPASPILSAR